MKIEFKGAAVYVALEGKFDTETSPKIEAEIGSALKGKTFDKVTFDFEKVSFVSSAGLRVILRYKHACDDIHLINVSSDVYEVFEMTGFTEIMDVQKAFRQISVDGCEIIGKGAAGTVYRIGSDSIVKVFKEGYDFKDIIRERELARRAFVLGIPTAMSFDIVKVGNLYGTVFELLNCDTLSALISKDPENVDKYAKMYSDLLHSLHGSEVKEGELPPMKVAEASRIDVIVRHLPEKEGQKYKKMLEEIPECLNVCHGDCHIKNVMVQNGEPLLIDMDTLTTGSPVFDFGRIYNAFFGYTELMNQQDDPFMGVEYGLLKKFFRLTLGHYFHTADEAAIETYFKKFEVIGLAYLYHHYFALDKFRARVPDGNFTWLENTLVSDIDAIDDLLIK